MQVFICCIVQLLCVLGRAEYYKSIYWHFVLSDNVHNCIYLFSSHFHPKCHTKQRAGSASPIGTWVWGPCLGMQNWHYTAEPHITSNDSAISSVRIHTLTRQSAARHTSVFQQSSQMHAEKLRESELPHRRQRKLQGSSSPPLLVQAGAPHRYCESKPPNLPWQTLKVGQLAAQKYTTFCCCAVCMAKIRNITVQHIFLHIFLLSPMYKCS